MQSGRELPKLLEMGVLAVLLQTEVFLEKHKNDISTIRHGRVQ